jgi:hypothetical protein
MSHIRLAQTKDIPLLLEDGSRIQTATRAYDTEGIQTGSSAGKAHFAVGAQGALADANRQIDLNTHYTYQWFKDGVAIAGANTGRYQVTAADQGHAISFKATAVSAAVQAQHIHDEALAIAQAIADTVNGVASAVNRWVGGDHMGNGAMLDIVIQPIDETALQALITHITSELSAGHASFNVNQLAVVQQAKVVFGQVHISDDTLAWLNASYQEALYRTDSRSDSSDSAATNTATNNAQERIYIRDDQGTHIENMGWIASRLPSLHYDQGYYTLTFTDADTGARQAIAPMWKVNTVKIAANAAIWQKTA